MSQGLYEGGGKITTRSPPEPDHCMSAVSKTFPPSPEQ